MEVDATDFQPWLAMPLKCETEYAFSFKDICQCFLQKQKSRLRQLLNTSLEQSHEFKSSGEQPIMLAS